MRRAARGEVRLLVSVLLALETGCATGHPPEELVSVRDSAGVSIVTINAGPATLPLRNLEPEPRLVIEGGVEGIPDFVSLGAVRWLSDGRILAVDAGTNVVYLFAASGALIRSYGRRGDGPGEFRAIAGASVTPGDSILLFDRSHRRGTWLDDNLHLVRTVPVPGPATLGTAPLGLLPIGPGVLVAHRSRFEESLLEPGLEIQRSRSQEDLLLYRTDGTLLDSVSPFEGRHGIRVTDADYRAPWSPRPFVTADTARVVYGTGDAWRLTLLARDLGPVRDVRWPSMNEALSSGEVDRFRADVRATLAQMTDAQADHLLDIQFSPRILPGGRPAIGRVILDSDGPIWVGRFKPLSWPIPWEPTDWVILTSDGTPMSRMRLPDRVRLEEVRGDTLLVVESDSLDVERVTVYVVREQEAGRGGR